MFRLYTELYILHTKRTKIRKKKAGERDFTVPLTLK